ncbi:MAG TPA: hypothetical protein VMV18_02670 [bacterium]|nr:hypothetical protein [bacterium]
MEITVLLLLFALAAGWLWWRVRARAEEQDEESFLALFEAESGAEAEADSDTEAESGSETEAESVADADTVSEPDSDSVSDSERKPKAPVRGTKRRRKTNPALPVVLAHGMFGFDEVKLRGKRYEYFRGVRTALTREGAKVHVVKLAPTAAIEERAEGLADAVRALGAEKVNLIAHSQGGVDARYAISRLGLARNVASLTTVGAPHRGTPLADAGSKVLGKKAARVLRMEGVADLTTRRMKRFNREVPDAKGVAYHSVVGAVSGLVPARMHPLLLPGFLWMRDRAGVNDGVVPSDSQSWGEILAEVDADHWAQIGWSKGARGFDARDLYTGILRELRARGF